MITKQEFDQYINSNDPSTGWTLIEGTEEELHERINKIILKARTEAYDEGYKAGANQKDNKPCVCGFWNKNG